MIHIECLKIKSVVSTILSKALDALKKTSICRTIIIIVIPYNEFNCINTQVSREFLFKAKLVITCKYICIKCYNCN